MHDGILIINKLIKTNLSGLPSFSKLVIYEALTYLDYSQGKIFLPTLYEFAVNDLFVERAPGRKREVVNENTIRNALRTIKKFKGDFFKIRSVNQRIVIEMPFIRDLYAEYTKKQEVTAEVTGDDAEAKTLATTGQNVGLDSKLTAEVTGEFTAVTSSINNIFINKNITTTQLASIADDFYPSDELIQKATELGFTKVEDNTEIQAFIDYNKSRAAKWADYNPLYLRWLKRGFEHQLRQQAKIEETQQQTRSTNHVSHSYKPGNRVQQRIETPGERVRRHREQKKQQAGVVINAEH